jgi:hypothetical protein
MTIRNLSTVILCLTLVCAVFPLAARADDWNQMTKMTFSGPVEIPGMVLPAGTYWFVLQNNWADRNLVQIFSADWSKVDATVITATSYRREPKAHTEIEFAERPHDKPEALLKWYYPGELIGHEFLYSMRHEKEFARDRKRDEVAAPLTLASNRVANQP